MWRHSLLHYVPANILVTAAIAPDADRARVDCDAETEGGARVTLYGRWDIRAIHERPHELLKCLESAATHATRWDLTQIRDIDAAGATLMWHAWKRQRPQQLSLRTEDSWVFDNLAQLSSVAAQPRPGGGAEIVSLLGRAGLGILSTSADLLGLLGAAAIDALGMLRSIREIPRREITATIFRSGAQALAISGLVGFLIGIVLCYLSGEQLREIGAETYIVNLTGFAVFRELGPMLAAILNAGRSGSAMTAQIGVMRVTGELEALSVLGISHVRRLVVPKLIGQVVALPLVVAWTDLTAIVGAMVGAQLQLGIAPSDFLRGIVQVIPLSSVLFGIGKGVLFGATIALISCHFGFRVKPDSESLAAGTTRAVVTGLTAVLVIDAVLAIAFSHLGM